MTIATWILALATVALAVEGATFLRQWIAQIRPGRRQRELEELRRQITILHHAAWMDVTTASQGTRTEVDEKVRTMLQLDGWAPDMALMERAGYFNMARLRGDVPGVTE